MKINLRQRNIQAFHLPQLKKAYGTGVIILLVHFMKIALK